MPISILPPAPTRPLTPTQETMLAEALEGLQQTQKTLPCKYFYDAEGSKLFDAITELDAYYLTRTEVGIMETAIDDIVATLGEHVVLVEYGSGSSYKTRLLLDHLEHAVGYIPIDISRTHLFETAERLRARYPNLPIHPVAADYTADFTLPTMTRAHRVVVYFPGSTLGNFSASEAEVFLKHIAEVVGPGGGLLIGIDLKKDRARLEAAYDDQEGVTAAFNMNLLHRLNRELGSTFDVSQFAHKAIYNKAAGRIEMHLVSLSNQCVQIGGKQIPFAAGETIWTESSHKYSLAEFANLAARAGFAIDHVWTDPEQLFSVQYLRAL